MVRLSPIMALEKKIKSFRSSLQVKEMQINQKMDTLMTFLNESTELDLLTELDRQIKQMLDDFLQVVGDFQVLLIENGDGAELQPTIDDLNKNYRLLEQKVLKCRDHLAKFKKSRTVSNTLPSRSDSPHQRSACNLKLPELKLMIFDDNNSDLFAFDSFRSSFCNAMASFSGITNIEKIIYLKSSLRGRALALVEHLPVNEDSFDEAWQLLEDEFYDADFLLNSVISKIIDYPKCSDLNSTMEFCTSLKSWVLNLRKMNYDFETVETAGNLIMSNLVRSKIPTFFLQELCRRSGVGYPSLNHFLEYSSEMAKMFKKSSSNASGFKKTEISKNYATKTYSNVSKSDIKSSPQGSDKNFLRSCKFCLGTNHSTLRCKTYYSYADRIKKADSLSLCTKCLSKNHQFDMCPGKKGKLPYPCTSCKQTDHITSLCPNMVLSLSAGKFSNHD